VARGRLRIGCAETEEKVVVQIDDGLSKDRQRR
jgi:hypothetical protein